MMKYIFFLTFTAASMWNSDFTLRVNPASQPGTSYSYVATSTDPIGYVVPLEASVTHLLTATETAALIATYVPYVPPLP